MFAVGLPIETAPVAGVCSKTSYTQQPTTVSVGPYSLKILVRGAFSRQKESDSAISASPPRMKARLQSETRSPADACASNSRWAGVIFTKLRPQSAFRLSASPSMLEASVLNLTLLPFSSGANSVVTTMSNVIGEKTTEPSPSLT